MDDEDHLDDADADDDVQGDAAHNDDVFERIGDGRADVDSAADNVMMLLTMMLMAMPMMVLMMLVTI